MSTTPPQPTSFLHPEVKAWWKNPSVTAIPLHDATRTGFGQGLLDAAAKRKDILALTADLGGSTGLGPFKERFPDRFLDVGVAEQSLAGVGAGLASEGYHVVITSFAAFSPGRNWDFLRVQASLAQLPILIVGSHAGLATGADGGTHQALEDVALLRSLPGITIISPCDALEAAVATQALLKLATPSYLRLARPETPAILSLAALQGFKIGRAMPLLKGRDATILTTGIMAPIALAVAKTLWKEHHLSIGVLHVATITPLDRAAVLAAAKATPLLMTLEDHHVNGGLGSAVAEVLAEQGSPAKLIRKGTKAFGSSGKPAELYAIHGLDAVSLAQTIRSSVATRRR
jgi:transketolase